MSDLATKADLAELKAELTSELKGELASKADLAAAVAGLATKAELAEFRQEFRHQGVLFEQLRTNVQVIAEGLVGLREQVTDEIRALRKELSSRITLLEEVVRKNSGDLLQDVKTDLQAVKADVADLRRRFDRLERESDLEKRVAEVEKRLGIR
jgi:hypothetical protein